MDYWKCINTLTIENDEIFTKGQLYQGWPWHRENEKGDDTEVAGVSFRNNQGNIHFGPFDWVYEYFTKIPSEAEKEADREAERQELWQPSDEPYEPDYWGAWYE